MSLIVDFAPHAIHYAGRCDDHWYVSLVQAPLLLALDDAGVVVRRFAVANVIAVRDGIAYASTVSRVRPANVQREPALQQPGTIAWDLATDRELWRRANAGTTPPERAADPRVAPSPGGFALEGHAYAYVDNERGGRYRRYDWDAMHVEKDSLVVVGNMRVLRIPIGAPLGERLVARVVAADVGEAPLEPATVFFVGGERLLVDHPTRGRFWFDVAGTGLAKGDAVEIGGFLSANETTIATVLVRKGAVVCRVPAPSGPGSGEEIVATTFVAEPSESRPPDAFVTLVSALVHAGLLDAMSPDEVAELWQEHFGEMDAGAVTAGNVFAAVYPAGSGAARGVVVHDHRFGNETDDVVAELAATLPRDRVGFTQEAVRKDALRIRAADRAEWVSFADGGLDAIVRWMNRRLEESGATHRIRSFDTNGDDHCFVVCEPDVLAALERRGVRL